MTLDTTFLEDRIRGIACVDTQRIVFELVSTQGSYCDVWRSAGMRIRPGRRRSFDVVVKRYRRPCSRREVQVMTKEFIRLRSELQDIVPNTIYVETPLDGHSGLIVISQGVRTWFNIANPTNEDEAIPLLRKLPKARNQLLRFCHAARKWEFEPQPKVIDLYGADNLVLNADRELRYLDSFHFFFYADMLDYIDDEDLALQQKIEISVHRRQYLDYMLRQIQRKVVAVNTRPEIPDTAFITVNARPGSGR